MKVTVNDVTGFEDAFIAMFMSKRTWTPELDAEIRTVCREVLMYNGQIHPFAKQRNIVKFNDWLEKLLRMGRKHITVLRYIDISIMTEGLHRAGQDDVDAHARRFDNRIIRSSTRLAEFSEGEMSDFYKGKIIPTNMALSILGIEIPDSFEYDGAIWVKSANGYIKEEFKDDKDVKRGLYMLSIPSNFVSKINLCEFGHVFGERNADGGANPEVKEWAESVMAQLTEFHKQITRDYVLSIQN